MHRRSSLPSLLAILAVLTGAAVIAMVGSATQPATPQTEYFALGDSITSGTGTENVSHDASALPTEALTEKRPLIEAPPR